jgi:hypothetical protein
MTPIELEARRIDTTVSGIGIILSLAALCACAWLAHFWIGLAFTSFCASCTLHASQKMFCEAFDRLKKEDAA